MKKTSSVFWIRGQTLYNISMRLLNKNIISALLVSFVFTMTVGGFVSSEMMMSDDGMMQPCPFMGAASICNMSPLEHFSQWQQMFTSIPQEFSIASLLLLLALALVSYFIGHLSPPKRTEVFVPRHRYRERVFDPLKLAYARGILNPKLY